MIPRSSPSPAAAGTCAQDLAFEIDFLAAVARRLPRDRGVLELLTEAYARAGRNADSLRIDRRLVRLDPVSADARYNLACSLALVGRPADSIRELETARQLGFADREFLLTDPDLASLRDRPSFRRLLERFPTPRPAGSRRRQRVRTTPVGESRAARP